MSDLRVIRWLRSIDAKLDEMKADRDRALAEIDVELHEHGEQLDRHDGLIADVVRRLERVEDRLDRALHALRTKKPPKGA